LVDSRDADPRELWHANRLTVRFCEITVQIDCTETNHMNE